MSTKHEYEISKQYTKTEHKIMLDPTNRDRRPRIDLCENCNHEAPHTEDCALIYVGLQTLGGSYHSIGLTLDAALDLMRAMLAVYDEAIERRGLKK
jgi:hypothetical protein